MLYMVHLTITHRTFCLAAFLKLQVSFAEYSLFYRALLRVVHGTYKEPTYCTWYI